MLKRGQGRLRLKKGTVFGGEDDMGSVEGIILL